MTTASDVWDLWTCRAQLVRVTDGDTVVMTMDQGYGGRQEEAIRLIRDWAPEKRDVGYLETTTFTGQWYRSVLATTRRRWPFVVQSIPNTNLEPNEGRSFVRYLGLIYAYDDPENCLNDQVAVFLEQHPEWGPGTT